MNGLDWNLLRSFLTVAETGSLSAAARQLGASQPTLGRHIEELETELGVSLFARHPRGLHVTQDGAALCGLAQDIRAQVDRFERRAAGLDRGLSGTVRVSASEIVALYVLPGLLRELRVTHPGIDFEVVADNRAANLLRRDADVAIRMFQPTQQDLIARKVVDAPLGLFATESYIDRYGLPLALDVLQRHCFVGFDRNDLHLRLLASLGMTASREDFKVRSDSQAFLLQAVVDGLGVGAVQPAIARRFAGLVPVLQDLRLPSLPVWLVAHSDVRRNARVRAVFDGLAAGLRGFYSADV